MSLLRLFGLVSMILVCGTSGCRKKSAPVSPLIPPATETASAIGLKPEDLPNHKALYDAITKYMAANQGRAAKDIHELVAKGYLKPLPPLPPGKHYDLDQRSAILRIMD